MRAIPTGAAAGNAIATGGNANPRSSCNCVPCVVRSISCLLKPRHIPSCGADAVGVPSAPRSKTTVRSAVGDDAGHATVFVMPWEQQAAGLRTDTQSPAGDRMWLLDLRWCSRRVLHWRSPPAGAYPCPGPGGGTATGNLLEPEDLVT